MPGPVPAAGLAALLAVSNPAVPPRTAVASFATAGAADPASASVDLRAADTRMTIAVTIDGAGPFRFLVDSGATRTVVSDKVAALLALKPAGSVRLHSVGGEGDVPAVRIDALGVGALRTRAIVAPVLAEENIGAAGIVGLDALAGGRVVIDLAANRMTIERATTRPKPMPDGEEIVVTAQRRYGQLVLADADAAGQKIWAVVDTGSMMTLGNGKLRERLVRRKRATPAPIVITDVAGREIVASYAPLPEVRLSNSHLHGVVIAFSDAHAFERFGLSEKPSMLLGMDMMRAFDRVSIDFGNRTVRLFKRAEL